MFFRVTRLQVKPPPFFRACVTVELSRRSFLVREAVPANESQLPPTRLHVVVSTLGPGHVTQWQSARLPPGRAEGVPGSLGGRAPRRPGRGSFCPFLPPSPPPLSCGPRGPRPGPSERKCQGAACGGLPRLWDFSYKFSILLQRPARTEPLCTHPGPWMGSQLSLCAGVCVVTDGRSLPERQ